MSEECWIAVDTSAHVGSIALAHQQTRVWRYLSATSSNVLLPELIDLLAEYSLKLDDITHIACNQGPGGFTGLRVGAAAMQGLSWGLKRPLFGVCALEAAAQAYVENCSEQTPASNIWVAQDARLGEAFWAQFRKTSQGWEYLQAPQLSVPDAMLSPAAAEWAAVGSAWLLYPDLKKQYEHLLVDVATDIVSHAGSILSVAQQHVLVGQHGQIGRIDLNYVRNRVAQTVSERKQVKDSLVLLKA
ncbi:MAG: tRNA (adenosine(37)-N6)-threonylcarbamoyltransferase complex dimerization subunit type 1 TsaB [Pseudomonadota bacterium]